jgi:UDP-perosamine 4-acetyltransferase
MKVKIILVGGGGHCKVIIDAIKMVNKLQIYGITDSDVKEKIVSGVSVIGDDSILPSVYKKGIKNAFVSVGSIGNCAVRKKISENLRRIGFNLPKIIHPSAVIASDVEIGEGTFIAAGVVINPGVKIGKNSIINTSSSIDHDCEIGDFVHVAPGVTLSGAVKIGDETHIGTGANVVQCVNIGKNVFVKAGSLVSKNVTDNKSYLE